MPQLGYDDIGQALAQYDALISEYAGPVALFVGTSPIEAKVGANALSGRTAVMVYNISNNEIYWGFANTVSVANGMPIPAGGMVIFKINPAKNIRIWLVSSVNSEIRIVETKS